MHKSIVLVIVVSGTFIASVANAASIIYVDVNGLMVRERAATKTHSEELKMELTRQKMAI